MIKACLFDLFGTLVSDAKNGGHSSGEEIPASWNESVDTLTPGRGAFGLDPVGDRNRVYENTRAWFEHDGARRPEVLQPGALDFVKELHRAGIRLASTATDCNPESVLSRVGLFSLFDYVATPGQVAERPDPQALTQAAKHLKISPRECIAFESTPEGVEAARSAGMRCVAVGDLTKLFRADMGVPSLKGMTLQRLRDGIEVPQHEC